LHFDGIEFCDFMAVGCSDAITSNLYALTKSKLNQIDKAIEG